MGYSIGTIMTGPDLVSATEDFNNGAKPLFEAAGASSVAGWQLTSGPLTGAYGITSRWDSLDAADAFMVESAKQAAAGGDIGTMVSRYQVQLRGLFEELTEIGTTSGKYMVTSRFSTSGPLVGLDYAANLTTGSGAKGAIIGSAISMGEFSGQLVGQSFYDSLDVAAETLKKVSSDAQFVANAVAGGTKLESRIIFRSL